MAGKMSACGKLGLTKYGEKGVKDWTHRTYHICEDIMPKKHTDMKECKKKLEHLETCAINKEHGKMRHVLHKGLYKHHPWDFQMPKDTKKERAEAA